MASKHNFIFWPTQLKHAHSIDSFTTSTTQKSFHESQPRTQFYVSPVWHQRYNCLYDFLLKRRNILTDRRTRLLAKSIFKTFKVDSAVLSLLLRGEKTISAEYWMIRSIWFLYCRWNGLILYRVVWDLLLLRFSWQNV